MSATVCFCHGRESGPWGTKIRRLARVAEQFGCRVVSLDDRDTQDPDERVSRLLTTVADLPGPLILVGSSMGGYVAAVASAQLQPVGLFLMAPAVGLPGYESLRPGRLGSPHHYRAWLGRCGGAPRHGPALRPKPASRTAPARRRPYSCRTASIGSRGCSPTFSAPASAGSGRSPRRANWLPPCNRHGRQGTP